MLIQSIKDGGVIYEGPFRTIKRTAEQAVRDGVNLSFADFRKADLRQAKLDGATLSGACFWGADLSGADLCGAYLHKSDLRLSRCEETCFAESAASACDFRGANFSKTIFTDCDLSASRFSCPTFLEQELQDVRSLKDCIYYHYGEQECVFSVPPLVIKGMQDRITVLGEHILIGSAYYGLQDYTGPYSAVISAILRIREGNFSDINALLMV